MKKRDRVPTGLALFELQFNFLIPHRLFFFSAQNSSWSTLNKFSGLLNDKITAVES